MAEQKIASLSCQDYVRQLLRAAGSNKLEQLEENTAFSDEQKLAALAEVFSYNALDYDNLQHCRGVFARISYSEAQQRDSLCLETKEGNWLLVLADPFDTTLLPWAMEKIVRPFQINVALRSDIQAWLASQETSLHAVDNALSETGDQLVSDRLVEELSMTSIDSDDSRVVRVVRSTLYDALRADASDIHIESQAKGLTIKYRLDGVLNHIGSIQEMGVAEQIISRIKVMAELDITETRVPQDGRFRATYKGRGIDFRVSVMPSVHGEDVVIRVLDKKALTDANQQLRLESLGLDDQVMAHMRQHFNSPYGMILVTGPTGSGKTTTLYAAISEINQGLDKIITIEDPVEYELPGVLQIPVNEKKGLSFSLGLRSILRHDPDKIMVGEIRDPDTAQIAVQSALTGHLVFTTVHANNVFDVLGRFLNMGVDPYSFVSALNIIIAQRLIRKVCQQCKTNVVIDDDYIKLMGAHPPQHAQPVKSTGCEACRWSGYRGRRAVAEVLTMDDELREMIASRTAIRQIKDYARSHGTVLLREAALEMAWQGITTLEEVNRVTSLV